MYPLIACIYIHRHFFYIIVVMATYLQICDAQRFVLWRICKWFPLRNRQSLNSIKLLTIMYKRKHIISIKYIVFHKRNKDSFVRDGSVEITSVVPTFHSMSLTGLFNALVISIIPLIYIFIYTKIVK